MNTTHSDEQGPQDQNGQPGIVTWLKNILRFGAWFGAGLIALVLILIAGLVSLLDQTPEESAAIRARMALKPCEKTEFIRVQINGVKLKVPREMVWSISRVVGEPVRARRGWCQKPENEFIDIVNLNLENPAYILLRAKKAIPEVMLPHFPNNIMLTNNLEPLGFVTTGNAGTMPMGGDDLGSKIGPGTFLNNEFESVPRLNIKKENTLSSYVRAKNYTVPNGYPFTMFCDAFQLRQRKGQAVRCSTYYVIVPDKIFLQYNLHLNFLSGFNSDLWVINVDNWIDTDKRLRVFLRSLVVHSSGNSSVK